MHATVLGHPLNPFNLFLIGYRCTGKSLVGKSLSAKLSWSFIDTDSLLVSERGLSIGEIVDSFGWETFRQWEGETLKQVCATGRQVVATGGGVVLIADNVKLMQESGRVIWLQATPETIKKRMQQDEKTQDFRPALSSRDSISEIEETLAERAPLYQHAMDFAVDTDDRGVDEICNEIIGKLNPD